MAPQTSPGGGLSRADSKRWPRAKPGPNVDTGLRPNGTNTNRQIVHGRVGTAVSFDSPSLHAGCCGGVFVRSKASAKSACMFRVLRLISPPKAWKFNQQSLENASFSTMCFSAFIRHMQFPVFAVPFCEPAIATVHPDASALKCSPSGSLRTCEPPFVHPACPSSRADGNWAHNAGRNSTSTDERLDNQMAKQALTNKRPTKACQMQLKGSLLFQAACSGSKPPLGLLEH